MKKKEEKCEHIFSPFAIIEDTQVFGTPDDKEIFMQDGGWAFVRCDVCGLQGFCILNLMD